MTSLDTVDTSLSEVQIVEFSRRAKRHDFLLASVTNVNRPTFEYFGLNLTTSDNLKKQFGTQTKYAEQILSVRKMSIF